MIRPRTRSNKCSPKLWAGCGLVRRTGQRPARLGLASGSADLGNPAEISIDEVAKKVIAPAGSGAGIETRPLPADDPHCPDISLARRALGWEPEVSLEDGLTKTIEYVRARPTHQDQAIGRLRRKVHYTGGAFWV